MQYGHEVAVQYRELLQLVMHILNKPTNEVSPIGWVGHKIVEVEPK